MSKKMLIDATHPEETRVVVVDGNKVDDFDFESINKRQLAGNIYLAKVTRVEPSLQAAFVDYGGNRHGFLAFAEIHPDYYQIPVADRQALLREEAQAQREAAEEENGEGGGRSRNRRSRNRRDGKRDQGTGGAKGSQREAAPAPGAEIAGFAVIEPEGDSAEDDDGPLSMGDATAPAAAPAAESGAEETPAVASAGDKNAGVATAEAATDETTAAEVEADEIMADEAPRPAEGETGSDTADAADETEEDGGTPRSMAEDTGLDGEDERVTEEIGARPARKEETDAAEAEAAGTDAQAAAETEAVPAEGDAAEESEAEETGADESGTAEAAKADGDEAEDAPAEGSRPKSRRRRRRSRGSREDAPKAEAGQGETAEASAADDNGDDVPAAEEVDSIGSEDLREEEVEARAHRRRRYRIQDVVKVRQIMLVQVVKEERGNKGAALTTYLSLAGRYCVLMPNTARGGGISRKIVSAADRKRLREIVAELDVPEGMGLIVRTAGAERTRAEIKRDYEFLLRQWEQVRELTLKSSAPCLIYEEGSLIKRTIRDIYSKDVDTILVAGDAGYREAKDYMKMLMPSHAKNVQQYADKVPLFIRYQVESYLNGMFSPVVQLKSGGYIVIGVTEALVAIDVNSGRSTREGSIEDTAAKTNLEAADEVARQLRLRDLAGLIVIDFIDMEDSRNIRAVEKRMKERLKTDRARIQVGRISAFGLMEMSRQRLRPGMLEATTQPCPHCHGQGIIRSDENMALAILREIEEEGVRGRSAEVSVTLPVEIANYLINFKRRHLASIEERYEMVINVFGDATLLTPNYKIERSKTQSRAVMTSGAPAITAQSVARDFDFDTNIEDAEEVAEEAAAPAPARPAPSGDDAEGKGGKRRRRGKRGGRRRQSSGEGDDAQAKEAGETAGASDAEPAKPAEAAVQDAAPAEAGASDEAAAAPAPVEAETAEPAPKKRRTRRKKADVEADAGEAPAEAEPAKKPAPRRRKSAKAAAAEAAAEPAPAETAAEPQPEAAPQPDAAPVEEPDTVATAEPIAASEALEPAAPEQEPEAQAEVQLQPAPEEPAAEPSRPKRRGWWSLR
ncbi:Rne/Rng family ribonuclease [Limibaculum sp. M0105]|uniref:Ribonuclease E n=1 Tax=Thermohalobaculum xanthum TaxID=2753746 RepID=A0A8J7M4A6_9RHOB|nr:ribonuclease E/G [Thermohalobaculum xanthum]MBK0397979.1 Rne/Rng family ribonuclease [Thermohalobaculum xanthum]